MAMANESIKLATAINLASAAAQAAADAWEAEGNHWYPCGNAHLCANGNSKLGRWARVQGEPLYSRGVTLPITYRQRGNQAYYLHCAAINAAQAKLAELGYETRVWEYID